MALSSRILTLHASRQPCLLACLDKTEQMKRVSKKKCFFKLHPFLQLSENLPSDASVCHPPSGTCQCLMFPAASAAVMATKRHRSKETHRPRKHSAHLAKKEQRPAFPPHPLLLSTAFTLVTHLTLKCPCLCDSRAGLRLSSLYIHTDTHPEILPQTDIQDWCCLPMLSRILFQKLKHSLQMIPKIPGTQKV